MAPNDLNRARILRWLRVIFEILGLAGLWLSSTALIDLLFSDREMRRLIAQSYVVGSCIVFGSLLIIFVMWKARKEKYANITEYTHRVNHSIRDLTTYITMFDQGKIACDAYQFTETVKTKLGEVLDKLQLTFVSITGTNCRTSIKLVYNYNGTGYYFTLARDNTSLQRCRAMDDKRVKSNHDPLEKNAQFSKLFSDANSVFHYFSNDLPADKTFSSTSFTAYDESWGQTGLADGWWFSHRRSQWPLPYKSTIACVIRHGPAAFIPEEKEIVLGFVTVDSESRGVFTERWDVPLVFAVSDALYHPIRKLLEIQNREAHPNGGSTQTAPSGTPGP
jgi:hypothetical protein